MQENVGNTEAFTPVESGHANHFSPFSPAPFMGDGAGEPLPAKRLAP